MSKESNVRVNQCPVCGTYFARVVFQQYCSRKCWVHVQKQSKGEVSTGTQGAIAELSISADLLRKGYNVFRAISPACAYDLVASKFSEVWHIEVRTAVRCEGIWRGTLHVKSPLVNCLALWEKATGSVAYITSDTHMSIVQLTGPYIVEV